MWTPLQGMKFTEVTGEVMHAENNLLTKGVLTLEPIDVKFVGSVINGKVNATALVDYNSKKTDIRLHGRLIPVDENKHDFNGVLTNDKVSYNITGNVISKEGVPIDMSYEVRPDKGGNAITIKYNFQEQPKGHAVKCTIRQGYTYGNLEMHTTMHGQDDWDVRVHVSLALFHVLYCIFNIYFWFTIVGF